MKTAITLTLFLFSFHVFGQDDKSKLLEQRARNLHNVLGKNNKAAWKSFMTRNFTQALIERPMRAQVVTTENDNASSTSTSTEHAIEAKLAMFERLHQDFGKAKVSSVKVEGDKVAMTVTTDHGMTAIFRMEAEPKSPWLIDKLTIEVEATN
ncbi:MAG TPA: hypothetical protein VGD65_08545 [Chryseosolibacter sp.]